MHVTIEAINRHNKSEYDQFIFSRDDTTFVDCWEWRELLEKVYKLSHYWYIAREHGQITGSLCLTLAHHRIFGRYLVTAPFANQGGFYTDTENTFKTLLNKVSELQYTLQARYILIRHLNGNLNPPEGWQQDHSYATSFLKLTSDPELFFRKQLESKTRNQVLKSINNGFTVKFGRFELLQDFWYVMSHSMKELGSPYHSRRYLETLLKVFGNKSELVTIYTKDLKPAGGSLLLYHCNKATLLHANILRKYRPLCAGDFLYWSTIDECCRRGIKCLDMGRSLVGSGNELFKMKWSPIRHTLAYWYKMATNKELPYLNQANPRFQLAIKLWQIMPLWLLRLAGPHVISGIL